MPRQVKRIKPLIYVFYEGGFYHGKNLLQKIHKPVLDNSLSIVYIVI